MPHRTAARRSNPAVGVCASVLPEQLPDDPAVLKALLLAQQRAFEMQLNTQLTAQFETLRLAQEATLKAYEADLQKVVHTREVELQKAFDARELELQKAFDAREAELQKGFEARILELYEQLRLARRRMLWGCADRSRPCRRSRSFGAGHCIAGCADLSFHQHADDGDHRPASGMAG